MRRLGVALAALACLAAGCKDAPQWPKNPVAPASAPSGTGTATITFGFFEPYTAINVGEVIAKQSGDGNPWCPALPGWECQFFRLTAPRDGELDLRLAYALGSSTQPIDLSLNDRTGVTWWGTFGRPYPPAGTGDLKATVKADAVYQITVWYLKPGVEFELSSSLR